MRKRTVGRILMVDIIFSADVMKTVDFYYGTTLADRNPFNWMSLSDYISGTYNFGTNAITLAVLFAAAALLCCLCVW